MSLPFSHCTNIVYSESNVSSREYVLSQGWEASTVPKGCLNDCQLLGNCVDKMLIKE